MANTVTVTESSLVSNRSLVLPDQFSVEVFTNWAPEDILEKGGEDEVLLTKPLRTGGEDVDLLLDNEIQNPN
jgi:hypothetical protein